PVGFTPALAATGRPPAPAIPEPTAATRPDPAGVAARQAPAERARPAVPRRPRGRRAGDEEESFEHHTFRLT
ncbi:hypothetical protein L6E12_28090, partial [Actinokineospora sp. PR83]|uniref:hypothetical protein n=1 Tax=Actinokineospora sp. PR83 TaxID=2884908 RepID=UPI001F2C74FE